MKDLKIEAFKSLNRDESQLEILKQAQIGILTRQLDDLRGLLIFAWTSMSLSRNFKFLTLDFRV